MKVYTILSAALLLLSASCGGSSEAPGNTGAATQAELPSGKTVFINNCVQCHAITQDKNGPKLAGSIQRWDNDTARLISYIRNSQEVIKSDPYAAKLFRDWSNMVMPSFPNLSDAEIKQVLEYIGKGED